MAQQTENHLKPEIIIGIVLKHRWLIIIPFCLSILVGIYLSFTLPKKYEASTMIMVQAQKVPDSYVQSVVSSDISSRLNTITQQVMSRTNIERIIETYQLYEGPEYNNIFLEDKVQAVRNRIVVDVEKSRNTELSTFSISYQGGKPEKVKNIANALATYIIDENLKVREAQATGTSDFLDDELEAMKLRLQKSEQELREYRQEYMGELPEQLEANLSGLERSRTELLNQQQALRETNNALAVLEQQIAESKQNTADSSMPGEGEEGEPTDLATLQAQLESLRTRYTENHPSVIRLKGMISKLKDQAIDIGNTDSEFQGVGSTDQRSGLTIIQENQLITLQLQKQNIEAEIAELKSMADIYQERVENTPKREEELLSIQRGYENLKSIYDSLYNRRLEAEISVNMEKKQKGEQFQIIDAARLPEKPISPDMQKLFLLTIAVGLGIGGGLIFLFEYTNKSFKSSDEAESVLGLPVLATIPSLRNPKAQVMSRINNVLSIIVGLFSLLLLSGFAVIALKGTDGAVEIIGRFL